MNAPNCPVHGSAMRAGKAPGSFFCPRKNSDGSWCDQKIAAPKNNAASPAPAATNGASTEPRHLLIVAALDFASRVYQGTGDPNGASELATSMYETWRNAL